MTDHRRQDHTYLTTCLTRLGSVRLRPASRRKASSHNPWKQTLSAEEYIAEDSEHDTTDLTMGKNTPAEGDQPISGDETVIVVYF